MLSHLNWLLICSFNILHVLYTGTGNSEFALVSVWTSVSWGTEPSTASCSCLCCCLIFSGYDLVLIFLCFIIASWACNVLVSCPDVRFWCFLKPIIPVLPLIIVDHYVVFLADLLIFDLYCMPQMVLILTYFPSHFYEPHSPPLNSFIHQHFDSWTNYQRYMK